MKSLWVRLRLLGILLAIVGGMMFYVNPVVASKSGEDYWFIETFTVGDVKLPEGVALRTSDSGVSPRGHLILENQTEPYLFVLSLDYKDVLAMTTPDPGWKTRVNAAHEVASYLVSPDRPAYLGMETLTALDRDLEDVNVLSPNPPIENMPIPAAQHSELLLVYDGQVIVVPFSVTYAPNTDFDIASKTPQQGMANAQATDVVSATVIQPAVAPALWVARDHMQVIGLLVGLGVILVGWLIWKRLARDNNSI